MEVEKSVSRSGLAYNLRVRNIMVNKAEAYGFGFELYRTVAIAISYGLRRVPYSGYEIWYKWTRFLKTGVVVHL